MRFCVQTRGRGQAGKRTTVRIPRLNFPTKPLSGEIERYSVTAFWINVASKLF